MMSIAPVSRFSFFDDVRAQPATREPGAPGCAGRRDPPRPRSTARWPSDG